eukprot:scaffold59016_cov28-Tisochrysis_lutea.AAC.1
MHTVKQEVFNGATLFVIVTPNTGTSAALLPEACAEKDSVARPGSAHMLHGMWCNRLVEAFEDEREAEHLAALEIQSTSPLGGLR